MMSLKESQNGNSVYTELKLDVDKKDEDSYSKLNNFSAKAALAIQKSLSRKQNKVITKQDNEPTCNKSKLSINTLHLETAKVDEEESPDIFPVDSLNRVNLFDHAPHPPLPPKGPKPRRAQSAKAKLLSDNTVKCKSRGVPETILETSLKARPASAHIIGATEIHEKQINGNQIGGKLGKPNDSPTKFLESNSTYSSGDNDNNPVPFIYGYKSGKIMSGTKCAELENTENEETNYDTTEHMRMNLPKCLEPFESWKVSGDIPRHWIGIDPSKCLVLCPSLLHQLDDLPTVPPKQLPDEELDYIEKILPPTPIKQIKYSHPWTKQPVESHTCKHIPSANLSTAAQVRIYSMEGDLLHETYRGNRTAGVVRKEIKELEDLMKGIGNHDGCLFVQYQAEINDIQDMISRNLERMEEIERREEEKRKRAETPDYFEMKSFYKEHDQVMQRIEQQHDLCVRELAALEEELRFDSDDRYFQKMITI